MEKIKSRSSSHVVRPGLAAFQNGGPERILDYKDIPGLRESTYRIGTSYPILSPSLSGSRLDTASHHHRNVSLSLCVGLCDN